MTLSELRQEVRFRLKDDAAPYFWSNDWINAAINEAVREACLRARLIEDASSSITSLDITTTEKRYDLSPLIIDILSAEYSAQPGQYLTGATLTESQFVLDEYPSADDTLLLTVIRFPLADMEDDDAPEIRAHHHIHLVDWVEYRAYGVKDADGFDPDGAALAEARFERRFGKRPDAGVQRKQRDKGGRVVRMNPF